MKGLMFSAPMILRLIAGAKTQTRRPGEQEECPFGKPGDRLWIREAIRRDGRAAVYVADGTPVAAIPRWTWSVSQLSPIYMPRVAARFEITLTATRQERLQKLSREDAIAEGAFWTDYGKHAHQISSDGGRSYHETLTQRAGWSMRPTTTDGECLGSPQTAFANFYNVVHGGERWNLKPEASPWDQDPLVWVLSFALERVGASWTASVALPPKSEAQP